MRNADLDDLKYEQYAEQVKQERKEVDAMPKSQITDPDLDLKAGTHKLGLAVGNMIYKAAKDHNREYYENVALPPPPADHTEHPPAPPFATPVVTPVPPEPPLI